MTYLQAFSDRQKFAGLSFTRQTENLSIVEKFFQEFEIEIQSQELKLKLLREKLERQVA